MSVRSGQSITKTFTTRVFATGVATNADSTPTGTLYVNGTADAATVTVTNITTGLYKAAVTLPTLAVGDVVDLRINATVSSVTDNAVIWTDTKDVELNASGHVSRVTLVDTTTTNTDMRGTDGAYTGTPPTASAISTQVGTDLSTAHGAGSWATATGFSTHSAADVWAVATRTLSGTLGSFDALWNKIKAWLGALAGKTADSGTLAEITATTAGAGYDNTTDSLQAVRDRGDAAWTGGGGDTTVNVMPVSGSATIGNVLDGGRIRGQYGAPLTGLTVTCTTTNAGVTSARDLTAYEGELALVVFENDDEMDYGTRIVHGSDITVSSNVATISSTASHVLNTLLGENLRWCLREDKAAPSIVFAIGDYTCQRAPVTA